MKAVLFGGLHSGPSFLETLFVQSTTCLRVVSLSDKGRLRGAGRSIPIMAFMKLFLGGGLQALGSSYRAEGFGAGSSCCCSRR